MEHIKRNLAPRLAKLLEHFPVVGIVGSRQAGKTTLAEQAAPNWSYFDLENPNDFDRISHDPYLFFEMHPNRVIIDEAQQMPQLFEILRGVVDAKRADKGRYILTGSSNHTLLKNISESLAGRMATIELDPLKANEYYQKPLSPIYHWFSTRLKKASIELVHPQLTLREVQWLWLKGGYPEPLLAKDEFFYKEWMRQFQMTYIERDIRKLFPKLNHLAYRNFVKTLSSLSGTIVNRSNVAMALEVNEKTIREYLSIAEGTFLWRQLPSYERSVIKQVTKMSKGYLRDTGLLHYLLHIPDFDSLSASPFVGHSFEGFVIEEFLRGLEAVNVAVDPYYYRTKRGVEIDLILEGQFGLMPIEIKRNSYVEMKKLKSLEAFVVTNKAPFGMLINQSQRMEWLTHNILQVPVGCL